MNEPKHSRDIADTEFQPLSGDAYADHARRMLGLPADAPITPRQRAEGKAAFLAACRPIAQMNETKEALRARIAALEIEVTSLSQRVCDECTGNGIYYLDGVPHPCVCVSEPEGADLVRADARREALRTALRFTYRERRAIAARKIRELIEAES